MIADDRSNENGTLHKLCQCGNNIDPRNMGEDATQCEWCEYPETPMYKINDYVDFIELFPLGFAAAGKGVKITRGNVTVYSWNKETALMIMNDYLESK
jgi:hypothetical protein